MAAKVPEALPLLAARDLTRPLAWHQGQPLSAGRFVAQAQALAQQLPAAGPAVNLCQDRYRFALGLAAALLRGHTSLMPPNALPETLGSLSHDGPAPYALVDDDHADAGGLRRVVVAPDAAADTPPPGAPTMSTLPPVPQIPGDLPAVCLLTSGSTGVPQPHLKRWSALVANIGAQAQRLAEQLHWPDLQGLTMVATVPPQHSFGFESSVLLPLLGGAGFDSGRPFYPADIVAALERVPRPRALVTTPFHLKTLLAAGLPLPPVDLLLSATAPLSPQLAAEAEQRLSATLIEIYGCTEAGQVASRRTTQGEVWTALGALRLWRETPAADDERFVVQGGHVTEATPLADILELLDERHFRLLGRANDLVHVAGKRSSLAHLNFHLNRVPGVVDGAFWLPEQVADGVVRTVAFVVAPELTAAQVIAGLRPHLEAAFVPRRVVMLPRLPREATGKLTAGALRALAAEHLREDAATPAAAAGDRHGAQHVDSANNEPTERTNNGLSAAPSASAETWFSIAADHPAFAGHFPSQPVLPGVALLTLVLQALDAQPALRAQVGARPGIEAVKFLAPVGPGARLCVRWSAPGSGLGFEVQDDRGRCVARGKLVPA